MTDTLFPRPDPDLKLRFLWLAIGYLLVFFVVYESITSNPIDLGLNMPLKDKLYHVIAYFSLMAWFAQIYHDRFQRNMIAVVFVFMGVLLEYIQLDFTEDRMFEYADMLADCIGIALGLALSMTKARNVLVRLEAVFK
jgi:VanZ family protein